VTHINEIMQEAMSRIDARMKDPHAMSGMETGFAHFDHLTGGLHNSELAILAARPSMGKTALALNIAEYVAMKLSITTLFVSLEMSSVELADRMVCTLAEVNGQRLRNNDLSKDERSKLVAKMAELSRAPLFIDDTPSRKVSEIAAAARRLKRKHQLGLVVVDYLQLIDPESSKEPRQEQVAKIARRLKCMARELKVPVLCLAQLNRQAEDTEPRLGHLRESGAIEQDADVVMFIHPITDPQPDEPNAKLIIAKQRNGPTGVVRLLWFENFTRFRTPERHGYDEFEQFNKAEQF